MKPFRRAWCRLLGTFRAHPCEDDLAIEIDGHLRLMIEDNQRLGMTPVDARRAAVAQFGNARATEEAARDQFGFPVLTAFFQDVRYAFRTLRKSPGFALTAIGSIALGIAANSQVFSLAEAVVLRPLSVPKPSQVVTVVSYARDERPFAGGSAPGLLSYPDFVDFRSKSKSFEGMTAIGEASFGFAVDKRAQPQSRVGLFVSGNFFDVLEVSPSAGRGFRPDEDQVPGRDAVVVISHDLWARDFGMRTDAIGRTVLLNGVTFTVIGVAPEQFTGPDQFTRAQLYVPMMMQTRLSADTRHDPLQQRDMRGLIAKGRLKPGVTVAAAAAEVKVIAGELARTYADTNRTTTATVFTELQLRYARDPYTPMLCSFLLLLAGSVLVIACGNVANLMLSRARARGREISIRQAIGAGRGRLIRQLLTESLVISVLGGTLGLALAAYVSSVISPITIPFEVPWVVELNLDRQVLLYALIATFASTIFFGLIPALQATRTDLVSDLRSVGGKSEKRGLFIGRNTSVIAQVAVSLMLLIVAAQALRGTLILLSGPAGFRTDHVLMASFNPPAIRYSPARTQEFYDSLVDQARRMPGVKAAALTLTVPMSPQLPERIVPEGLRLPSGAESVTAAGTSVGDGYFETLGIPIVRGREFRKTDTPDSRRVAIVNEAFVRKYYPNQDALGKRLRLSATGSQMEIVGVAKQSKYIFIVEPPIDMVYLPLRQNPEPHLTLLLQSDGPAADLAPPLRGLVHSLDPDQPLISVRSMEGYFGVRVTRMLNLMTGTMGAMAILGLALAVIGLYGVIAWSVTRRTREIGIRMAIGARRLDVLSMVLRHGVALAGAGLVIGVLMSLVVSKGVTAAIAVPPFNVPLLALVAAGLLAVAILGAYLPARRASLLDPNLVLRQD